MAGVPCVLHFRPGIHKSGPTSVVLEINQLGTLGTLRTGLKERELGSEDTRNRRGTAGTGPADIAAGRATSKMYSPLRNGKIEEGQTMTDAKELLSEEMIRQIEDAARTQNRKPAAVLEEAWKRYIATHRLERLAHRGEDQARALGIREEDIPQLVREVRRENRSRGR
jgi:hypothetical protein